MTKLEEQKAGFEVKVAERKMKESIGNGHGESKGGGRGKGVGKGKAAANTASAARLAAADPAAEVDIIAPVAAAHTTHASQSQA